MAATMEALSVLFALNDLYVEVMFEKQQLPMGDCCFLLLKNSNVLIVTNNFM